MLPINSEPHRRYNQLTGEWILVSPHRASRPWQGSQEKAAPDKRVMHDEKCFLCPGNERVNGDQNPTYTGPYVFKNDFAALLKDGGNLTIDEKLLRSEEAHGECRVICFSPRHDLSLPEMELREISQVIDLWQTQTEELGKKYPWVQIFENKGESMGCSNPHPHGQIWASSFLPNEATKEDTQLSKYFAENQSNLLLDYAQLELEKDERVVISNDDWLVVVPYWATWPFETLLLPRFHAARMTDLTTSQKKSLAEIMKRLLTRYDNLFETSFPYSMGWHGAPFLSENSDHWQLHAHFYPPLLRSASVKKFMVGYEMLANAQRDLTAEQASQRLSELSEVHYKSTLASH
ncbi:MAG: UDP-glucose--hexose-1-phosphate uridylyltransferase [Akkermansiaceae bacterium]